jgi:uncharacterized protein (TIGR02611 family)
MHQPDDNPNHPPRQEEHSPSPCRSYDAAVRVVIRQARRLIVLVVGTTILLIGIVLLVTPGPALVVIPAGLAILSIEFVWARRLLRRVKRGVQTGMDWQNREEWKWLVGLRKDRPKRASSDCD